MKIAMIGTGYVGLVTGACLDRGVLIRPLGDVIVLMPPLDVDADELHRIVDALAGAIGEVCG